MKFKPGQDMKTVYESNLRYYPHINDDTVLKKIHKPVVTPVPLPEKKHAPSGNTGAAGGASVNSGSGNGPELHEKPEKIQRKMNSDGFIPD